MTKPFMVRRTRFGAAPILVDMLLVKASISGRSSSSSGVVATMPEYVHQPAAATCSFFDLIQSIASVRASALSRATQGTVYSETIGILAAASAQDWSCFLVSCAP